MTTGWALQFQGRSRLHMLECWLDSLCSPRTGTMPGCGVREAYADGRDGVWSVYVSDTEADRLARAGQAFLADDAAVRQHAAGVAAAARRCRSAVDGCVAAVRRNGVPHADVAAALEAFFAGYTDLQAHYHATSPTFTARAERELAEALSRRGADEPGALATLTYGDPRELRSYQESVRWLELLLADRREDWSDDERDRALAAHATAFGFTGALTDSLGTDPLEQCRQRWAQECASPPDDIAARLHDLRAGVDRDLAARNRLIDVLDLPDHERGVAGRLGTLGVRRLAIREEFTYAAQAAYHAFAQVFAQVSDLGPEGVRQLTRAEVIRIAAGDGIAIGEVVSRLRRGGCSVVDGQVRVVSGVGPDVARPRPTEPSEDRRTPEAERLRGLVVSGQATVTGRVRVLTPSMSRQEQVAAADLAQADEILVVAMTYPAIVSACARVRGIVTDFGGLTCHAAVIARAVGVPCVVGATDATRVLRTGDTVRMIIETGDVVVVRRAVEHGQEDS